MNTTRNDGGPAFPEPIGETFGRSFAPQLGMSLRDYFATQAMQALLSQSHAGPKEPMHMGHGWGEDAANHLNCHERAAMYSIVSFAYQFADAMLAERDK